MYDVQMGRNKNNFCVTYQLKKDHEWILIKRQDAEGNTAKCLFQQFYVLLGNSIEIVWMGRTGIITKRGKIAP